MYQFSHFRTLRIYYIYIYVLFNFALIFLWTLARHTFHGKISTEHFSFNLYLSQTWVHFFPSASKFRGWFDSTTHAAEQTQSIRYLVFEIGLRKQWKPINSEVARWCSRRSRPKLTGVHCCDSHELVAAAARPPSAVLPPPTYAHTCTTARDTTDSQHAVSFANDSLHY